MSFVDTMGGQLPWFMQHCFGSLTLSTSEGLSTQSDLEVPSTVAFYVTVPAD